MRKIIGILIVGLFIGASFIPSIIIDVMAESFSDPIAYWNFDEESGNILHDSIGNYDGTVSGATWQTGKYGNALYFDGSNDYVQFSSPVLNNPPYSVCAWVKVYSLPSSGINNYIISNGGQTHDSYGFYMNIQGSPPDPFHFGATIQGGSQLHRSFYTASTGTWYFLVGTWDGSPVEDHLKLYVNGNIMGTYFSTSWYTGSADNLRMGAPSNQLTSFFHGLLDEVRIYNYVLSSSEVWNLYNQGPSNNPPYEPSNPNPSNHATDVDTNADLSWTGGDPDSGDTVTYDIYFGTNSNPPLKKTDHTTTNYDPGVMNLDTKYYWKIVAEDNHGESTTGPIWDFTTMIGENNPPHDPRYPSPGDNALNVNINADLSWTGGDPDSDDTVEYDVYFEAGDSTPDKLISYRQTEVTYELDTLDVNTKYYWRVDAIDNHGAFTEGDVWDFTTGSGDNQPPEDPILHVDPIWCELEEEESLVCTIETIDPNSDMISYYIEWGDGTYYNWSDCVPSGEAVLACYDYDNMGKYIVRAKAKDIYGLESGWSNSVEIKVFRKYTPPYYSEWDNPTEEKPRIFGNINRIMNIINIVLKKINPSFYQIVAYPYSNPNKNTGVLDVGCQCNIFVIPYEYEQTATSGIRGPENGKFKVSVDKNYNINFDLMINKKYASFITHAADGGEIYNGATSVTVGLYKSDGQKITSKSETLYTGSNIREPEHIDENNIALPISLNANLNKNTEYYFQVELLCHHYTSCLFPGWITNEGWVKITIRSVSCIPL